MAVYSLNKIAEITGGKLVGNPDWIIRRLLIDSRSASVSSSVLFFAITGAQHNGHSFIPDLYKRGVRAFIVSDPPDHELYPEAGFIKVTDTLNALQTLAGFHRKQYSCEVAAITGSNGKTIVKEWLYHSLSANFLITRSPKSYNSQVGVPLSLWLLDENTELAIIEAGISQPGEMDKLREIILPDTGIFTNLGEAHQENFSDQEQKITEKLKLFHNCKTLIYCSDQIITDKIIRQTEALSRVRLFTWAQTVKADISVKDIKKQSGKTKIQLEFQGASFTITIPFADDASIENAIHCVAFMLLHQTGTEMIISRMADLPSVAMRLEQKSGINNCTLINDSYNSDLTSLAIALDVLSRQFQHKTKTLIISDILQSGKNDRELYSKVSSLLKEKGVTRIIGIGPTITSQASLISIPGSFFESTASFIHEFNPDHFRDEAILLKGSRFFEFERIAALLEQKKHTTRVEINLNALAHNLNYFRSLLKPGTRTMVMVKALSYGSGRHEIAGVLQFQRVDYLGVAIADEGVSLREAGIRLPVIVMNPDPESFDIMIQHRLEPEIYNFEMLERFQKAVIRNQENNYPVHIKIDTGMHRLGFLKGETALLCNTLKQFQNIRVSSVFSHLAGADDVQFDDFTHEQIALFRLASDEIIQALGYPVIRHILNTAGIERFPEAQFDMVRLGIGLYGISNLSPGKLRNVSTLKSTILQIKTVEPGETVGYSRKGKPSKISQIAIVPVGYADGLNRRSGNGRVSFLIRGKKAPIIGNICMDMTMVDVTGIPVKEGDEVEIFGEGNSIAAIADKLETIPYEILTGVSERVKRVYYYE